VNDEGRLGEQFDEALATGAAIEHAIREHRGRGAPAWAGLGVPVIDRGTFAIFPLAQAPTRPGDAGEEPLAALAERLYRHWGYRYGGHDFRVGRLDPDGGYGLKLAEAGAVGRGPFWWDVQDIAVILVRTADGRRALETLALHAVPLDWVSSRPVGSTNRAQSRRRRMLRERAAAHVSWTWPD